MARRGEYPLDMFIWVFSVACSKGNGGGGASWQDGEYPHVGVTSEGKPVVRQVG